MEVDVAAAREKFASQADPDVLAGMRELAASEGRQLQAVMEDAMREYLDRRSSDRPRPQVMEALVQSIAEFDTLYARLAK